MKILVIGKEGRLEKNVKPEIYSRHSYVYMPINSEDKDVLAAASDAEIIIVDAIGKVSADLINNMPNLKMIHSEGVGFQGVDIDAAKKSHVYVCNCKGMNATPVAEQTILLMLGLLRGIISGDRAVREGRQIKVKEAHMTSGDLKELADCTVGLIGFGDIAKETARLLAAFGAKVIYSNRHRASDEIEKKYNVSYMNQDELLASSDIVSLHVPVTSETANMVNAEFLSKMKNGACIINTARGELVDSAALLEAIRNGKLNGAGLDCVAGEPVNADNIILSAEPEVAERIIYSPHVGGITASSFKRGYEMLWDDIGLIGQGRKPQHVVNSWD